MPGKLRWSGWVGKVGGPINTAVGLELRHQNAKFTDHLYSGWFDEAPSEGGDVIGKAPEGAHANAFLCLNLILF